MDKSGNNIYDNNGFVWQTWVHNCASLKLPDNAEKPLAGQVWPRELSCRLTGSGNIARWSSAYASQQGQIERFMTADEEAMAKRRTVKLSETRAISCRKRPIVELKINNLRPAR